MKTLKYTVLTLGCAGLLTVGLASNALAANTYTWTNAASPGALKTTMLPRADGMLNIQTHGKIIQINKGGLFSPAILTCQHATSNFNPKNPAKAVFSGACTVAPFSDLKGAKDMIIVSYKIVNNTVTFTGTGVGKYKGYTEKGAGVCNPNPAIFALGASLCRGTTTILSMAAK